VSDSGNEDLRVFSDRYHARILETPRAVRNALVYVLQNARKHGGWRAGQPDTYSSGPSFGGWKASAEPAVITADSRPGFLGRARSWLLSIGWRRHGLIDLTEAPVGSVWR